MFGWSILICALHIALLLICEMALFGQQLEPVPSPILSENSSLAFQILHVDTLLMEGNVCEQVANAKAFHLQM